jgi:hypothetical protein
MADEIILSLSKSLIIFALYNMYIPSPRLAILDECTAVNVRKKVQCLIKCFARINVGS